MSAAAQNSSQTAKRVPGKPFQPGDARINRGGRPPAVLSRALFAKLTPEKAEAGESWAMEKVWERTEGKVPTKNENGQPGDFDLDLSDDERTRIRSALKVVRGRRNA